MSNYFALLGLPERLDLDTNAIEESWRAKTRSLHSDDNDAGTPESDDPDLNRARTALSNPVTRLAHWLELKAPAGTADRTIDPVLMDLFSEISPVIERADALLTRHQKAGSALARAVLTREAIALQLKIQQLLQTIQPLKARIIAQFADFEKEAEGGRYAAASKGLGELKFLQRWEEQCRERLLSLIAC